MRLPDRAVGLLVLGLLVLAAGGCGSSARTPVHAIKVVGQEGLLSELQSARGEVVVLNVWATWCGPCVEELPHFARLVESTRGRGLRVIAVSFDDPETIESRVRPFVDEKDYPFSYLVKAQTNGDEYEAFINSIDPSWRGNVPATFVYDALGELHAASHEPVTYSQLREAVEPLLPGEPVAGASNRASAPAATPPAK